jgi:TolA-binding protein
MWPATKGSLGLPFVVSGPLLGLLFVIIGLVTGCADTAGEALRQDVAQLRQDLNSLTLAVHRSRGDTETTVGQLDRRTRDQTAERARQLTALSTRVDTMASEVGRLSARLEEISQRVDALSRQVAARGPSVAPSGPSPPAVITPGPSRGASDGPGAEQAYQAAYVDFTRGSFQLAITGFREFVRRFPDSSLADKAQYWIGESYFSLARASASAGRTLEATRELEQAVQEFRRVVLNYPRGEKVPTAIYKEALALAELQQTTLAQTRLKYLLDHFPQSEEAALAKERLAR